MSGNSVSFRLPFPPSVNGYKNPRVIKGRNGRLTVTMYVTDKGKQYVEDATIAVWQQLGGKPSPTRRQLKIEVILVMPDRRVRDIDNYSKVLLDSLSAIGIWEDDSQIKEAHYYHGGVRKGGWVEITVELLDNPEPVQLKFDWDNDGAPF